MEFKIKIINTSVAKSINWDEINAEDLNDVNILTIYVNKLDKDVRKDIKKIEILRSLIQLKSIQVRSNNPKHIEYFDTLLKDFQISKTALLTDDFENKDRSEINFKGLNYEEIAVPPEYSQWGMQLKHFIIPSNIIFGYMKMILVNKIWKY